MASAEIPIEVSHAGLADILNKHKLVVPPNQRDYSWTQTEVTRLFQDFAGAMLDDDGDYFLGTVVLVAKQGEIFEIVDGQQRLATTTLLLVAIRDHLAISDRQIAANIDRDYLSATSRNMRDIEPRLKLNLADNSFFEKIVADASSAVPTRASHVLLSDAYKEAKAHVRRVVAAFDENKHGDRLVDLMNFLKRGARVIVLSVSSEANAYRMFETLNDRGLRTTQADLVKNYVFGRAGDRVNEAQQKWATMRASLESVDEDRIPTVTFLRHALMLREDYFRENALHETVQRIVKSESQVTNLLDSFESLAFEYAALFNADSDRWNGFADSMRDAIRTLDLLNIASVRPLMMAVAAKFSKKEATAVFRKLISWKVRYLIAGATLTGGYIEVPLANAAKKVFQGELADENALSKFMATHLPTDDKFKQAFASATVSKASLAKYYLRSLEQHFNKNPDAAFVVNTDSQQITLEHVLPQKPGVNWPAFSDEEASADFKRIGNMTLLPAKKNSDLKSAPFSEKRKLYAEGVAYEITLQVARETTWTHKHVVERQLALADLAVKAWPLLTCSPPAVPT